MQRRQIQAQEKRDAKKICFASLEFDFFEFSSSLLLEYGHEFYQISSSRTQIYLQLTDKISLNLGSNSNLLLEYGR